MKSFIDTNIEISIQLLYRTHLNGNRYTKRLGLKKIEIKKNVDEFNIQIKPID
jgi:hypothetical protein